jgi:hypothetical protein
VLESFTGALLEPYVGVDNFGISMVAREDLLRIVTLLDARDLQVPGAGPIGGASVVLTLLAGEAVYADPGLGW